MKVFFDIALNINYVMMGLFLVSYFLRNEISLFNKVYKILGILFTISTIVVLVMLFYEAMHYLMQ